MASWVGASGAGVGDAADGNPVSKGAVEGSEKLLLSNLARGLSSKKLAELTSGEGVVGVVGVVGVTGVEGTTEVSGSEPAEAGASKIEVFVGVSAPLNKFFKASSFFCC